MSEAETQTIAEIARFDRSPHEIVVVSLARFKGHPRFDIRTHGAWIDGENMQPTKKGVNIDVKMLPILREAVTRAEEEARRLGLLPRKEPA